MTSQSLFMFRAACVACGAAVALGAFAAHGLKAHLSAEMLAVFEVGVRYQFYHGLALLACALGPAPIWANPWINRAAWAWCVGILLFSGSLYLLALTGVGVLGAVTPFGGVAFLLGWLFLLFGVRTPQGQTADSMSVKNA